MVLSGICIVSCVVERGRDRYVLEHMREHGYNVGGEPSGHIILSDYTTTGDGFVAALQVLAVVKKQNKPVSQVCHRFTPLPQVLKNVRYRSGKPLENSEVRSAIEDAEQRLNGHGRAGDDIGRYAAWATNSRAGKLVVTSIAAPRVLEQRVRRMIKLAYRKLARVATRCASFEDINRAVIQRSHFKAAMRGSAAKRLTVKSKSIFG